jgi:mono/diheme cytochrome c family protein
MRGEEKMELWRIALVCAALFLSGSALAQQKPAAPVAPGFPDAPGKNVLVSKCFQCHTPAMWMDHRQDRRGWESTLYRMVGRGALWTEDEIKAMADYLGTVYARKPQ